MGEGEGCARGQGDGGRIHGWRRHRQAQANRAQEQADGDQAHGAGDAGQVAG